MSRFKMLGLALVAVFAFAAALSTSAFALPELLKVEGANATFTGKNVGTAILENHAGTKVECKKATGSGAQTTDTLGTFHITFEECSSSGFACESKGDTKSILTLGSFHYVYDTLGTGEALGVAVLFLPSTTEFECVGGILKNKVTGIVTCLLQKPLESAKSHEFKCEPGTGKGEQKIKKYYNDGGTLVASQLLSSLNGGAFEESNEQANGTVEFKEAVAIMNE